MTPLPSKEKLARRQLFDPRRGTVTAKELVAMTHRKKKHLSDWCVGLLMWGIQEGQITKKEADIFESVFVRGAKIRKSRKHSGRAFLGPDSNAIVIDGKPFRGSSEDIEEGLTLETATKHPEYAKWVSNNLTGKYQDETWVEEEPDSEDEPEAGPAKTKSSSKKKVQAKPEKNQDNVKEGDLETDESDSEDESEAGPAKTKSSHKKKVHAKSDNKQEEDEEGDESVAAKPKSPRKKRVKRKALNTVGDSQEEDEEDLEEVVAAKPKSLRKKRVKSKARDTVGDSREEDL